MLCRIPGCGNQGSMEIALTFWCRKNEKDEWLSVTLGPFCDQCANITVDLTKSQGLPAEVFQKLTACIVSDGYAVSTDAMVFTIRNYGDTAKGLEYTPSPGKCHHPNCTEMATVKPVLIIPCHPIGVSYAEGDGYCSLHIQTRVDIRALDQASLRLTLHKLVTIGKSPILKKIRVEARLIEWRATDEAPNSVIITEHLDSEVKAARRKADNAHNN